MTYREGWRRVASPRQPTFSSATRSWLLPPGLLMASCLLRGKGIFPATPLPCWALASPFLQGVSVRLLSSDGPPQEKGGPPGGRAVNTKAPCWGPLQDSGRRHRMGLPILFCTGSLGSSLARNLPDQAGPGGSHQKSQLRCQGSWGMELHPPRDSPLLAAGSCLLLGEAWPPLPAPPSAVPAGEGVAWGAAGRLANDSSPPDLA